jgi:multidrug efflux pump subunit AcrA (membrane-fusion protein)
MFLKTVFLLGILIIISSCTKIFSTKKNVAEEKLPQVFLEKVKEEKEVDTLILPALVLSSINASMRSQVAGNVTKVYKKAGEKVQEGEVILEILNKDPAYEYRPYKLRSIQDGQIAEINAVLGSSVQVGESVVKIIDEKKLEFRVEIPSSELKRINSAEKIVLANKNNVEVEINQLSPMVNLETGTATCVLKIKGSQHPNIRVGEIEKVEFQFPSAPALWVSMDSLVFKSEKSYVRTLSIDKKIKWIEVQSGKERGEKIEIIKGLLKNQEIVLRSSRFVGEGDKVEVYSDTDSNTKNESIAR